MLNKSVMCATAIAICLPLSAVNALGLSGGSGGGLSVGVSVGSVSAGVDIGGGGISADVDLGGDKDVADGSGGYTGGGGSTGGGGTTDGGGTTGGGTDVADGQDGTMPMMPVAPESGMRIVGSPVWTSDEVLVGMITSVESQSGDQLLLRVQMSDSFGVHHSYVKFSVPMSAFNRNALRLPHDRSTLMAQLS